MEGVTLAPKPHMLPRALARRPRLSPCAAARYDGAMPPIDGVDAKQIRASLKELSAKADELRGLL